MDKIRIALAMIEAKVAALGERCDIGTITFGCALGHLDLRFDNLAWRNSRPAASCWYARFDARPSMVATRLKA